MRSSFLFWHYLFERDRIVIDRNIWWTKTTLIYTDKLEMISTVSSFIMRMLGRENLVLTYAGNIVTLFGVKKDIATRFINGYDPDEKPAEVTRLSTGDIMKLSILKSHLVRYLVLLALIWSVVLFMSSPLITYEQAELLSDFIFRHMIIAGTLILSIGLPTVILWLWAITGGFLKEFTKYYRYTAIRKKNTLSFEYGLLVHRRICIKADRIAIAEYSQTPFMRIFGYGVLQIRAVGYNPIFIKRQEIIPMLKESRLDGTVKTLLPEMKMKVGKRPKVKGRFHYYLYTWRALIPIFCALLSPMLGYGWLIAAGISALIVILSLILEYSFTCFESDRELTVFSHGGFKCTIACVHTNRIELISRVGSRNKLRKGFTNIYIHVFGQNGRYARIRNVDINTLDRFDIPSKINEKL